ncbi:hypothetical protein GCM10027020_35340 [Nocardioides salsibiostraticola]
MLRDPVPKQRVAVQPGALQIEFVEERLREACWLAIEFVEVVGSMERAGIDMPYQRTVVEVAPT